MLRQDNLHNGIINDLQQAPSDTDEEQDGEVVPVRPPGGQVHHIKHSLRRGFRKLAKVWANLESVHI